MIAYLTKDENRSLIFSKDKPAKWESKYNPLNDIFPEITPDNSPKMIEIKIIDSLDDDKNRKCFDEENMKYSTEFECPDGYEFQDEKGNTIDVNKIVLKKKGEKCLTV